jgi:hypothetical protein
LIVSIDHHEDEGQDEVLILFGCYNPLMYDHLLIVYQQKSNVVDQVGYLLCLEFYFLQLHFLADMIYLHFRMKYFQYTIQKSLLNRTQKITINYSNYTRSELLFIHIYLLNDQNSIERKMIKIDLFLVSNLMKNKNENRSL